MHKGPRKEYTHTNTFSQFMLFAFSSAAARRREVKESNANVYVKYAEVLIESKLVYLFKNMMAL